MKTSLRLGLALLVILLAAGCGSDDGPNSGREIGGGNNGGSADARLPDTGEPDATEGDTGEALPETVTYYEHVKPILDGRCNGCHVEDGIGPFALTTYEEAKAVRTGLSSQVANRIMPPWLAGQECAEYQHDYSLTEKQIDLITKWVDQDAPEGDPANEGAPLAEVGGGLSRVDMTLKMPQAYTPTNSPDDYRCIPIEWPEDATKYVTGFGVNPDQDSVVHHVIAFLAPPGLADEVAQKDAAEEGIGYTCYGGPGVGSQNPTDRSNGVGWIGSWAPGSQGSDFPDGTGIEVQPGSTVILQVHYNTLTTAPVADQTEVVLKVDDQVEKPAMYIPWTNPQWLGGDSMMIPAGSADTTHSFGFDLAGIAGQNIAIHDVALHMHTLGEKARLWIDRADGSEDCLLDIPRWDFDWQMGYRLTAPKTLRAGDTLNIECQWDNTAENQPVVDGQRLAPRDVTWGEGTTDEMCLGLMFVTFE